MKTRARFRQSSALRCGPTLAFAFALAILARIAFAQDTQDLRSALPRTQFRNGEATLRAFAAVSAETRQSIVKCNIDGETVALGAVLDEDGLTLTKASELKKGRLTCWLANEKEVDAELLATDEDEDVALLRVHAEGLKPIQWDSQEVSLGQWAITPGIAETPHAVGIVSALPRRIRPRRAYIGIQFELGSQAPRIDLVLPGLGAEQAGLKSGDIIVGVNNSAVTNREQVVETLREFREGQLVKLRVQRAEQEIEKEIRMMVPKPDQPAIGPEPDSRARRLAGNLSQRAEGFEQAIEHDTVLQPWLCGGPLVNLDGKAIGLNIARAGRVSTFALPSELILRLVDTLKTKAEATSRTSTQTPDSQ